MSESEEKSWPESLPFLFNLLVENADGIIDDTSLERILEWLKSVCENDQQLQKLLQCGTVEFLASEQVFSNPECAAFFLRLFGFLTSRTEIFNSLKCGKDGDFLARFLDKPKTESNLWNEGTVRNGYFHALISLTEHKDGMLWLRGTGHIDCALDCISDRSMYVANSARSLIAKYLIRESDWMPPHNAKEAPCSIMDNTAIITDRLRSMLSLELSASALSMIAVTEITRILLCENSITGQKLLQESKLLSQCLDLIKVGDASVCQKLVDVVCELAKNTRAWALDWGRLISQEESSASDILLGSCVDLFKKGLISTGLELVAGLGSCQESLRVFPPSWLEILFDIVEMLHELVLNPACHHTKGEQNGYNMNGGESLTAGLVDALMSEDQQQKSFAKQNLQCILSHWMKESHSVTQVICGALAAAQQLTEQASSRHYRHVLHWLQHSLDLIQRCVDPSKQSTMEVHGNQKVLKGALGFITSFTEVQRSKDIFRDSDFCTVNELFSELVRTLLELIERSESSATVISSSLKTLGKVLDTARPEFITELFSSGTTTEETSRKRARLDHSPPCEEEGKQMTAVRTREKLAFVLYRRLRDSRWEVRDSTLEFVGSLLQLNHDSVHEFLCRHSIPMIAWRAADDTNSYVRASAIHVISSFACHTQLWTSLLQIAHTTEENVLEKLSSVLEKDDEAFPRRRAMECLTLWVKSRHPTLAARILRTHDPSHPNNAETSLVSEISLLKGTAADPSFVTEAESKSHFHSSSAVSDFQNVGTESLSEVTKTSSRFGIARTICRACRDFDWEVKLRGLEFWEEVIDFFTGFKSHKESASGGKSGEVTICDDHDGECTKSGKVDMLFQVLFDIGALNILSEALNDCDHMVCQKSLEILACLQDITNPEESNIEQHVKTSKDFQESLGSGFGLEKFKNILRVADIPALIQSTDAADSTVRSDPVSLIEDILMAATHQDENLLDCY